MQDNEYNELLVALHKWFGELQANGNTEEVFCHLDQRKITPKVIYEEICNKTPLGLSLAKVWYQMMEKNF